MQQISKMKQANQNIYSINTYIYIIHDIKKIILNSF